MSIFAIDTAHGIGPLRGGATIEARDARTAVQFALEPVAAKLKPRDFPFDLTVRAINGRARRFRVTSQARFEPLRTCRVCACVEDDACEDGCSWIASDLCSACAP